MLFCVVSNQKYKDMSRDKLFQSKHTLTYLLERLAALIQSRKPFQFYQITFGQSISVENCFFFKGV